jgi:curli production assembly/transport component CsgF
MTKNEIFNKEDETFLRVIRTTSIIVSFMLLPIISIELAADEIKFGFKNPSFSGVGTSSHYLTIDSQEMSRKDALEAEIKALKDQMERDAENTTLARFIKNFESRVYAQLSRQLVDQLFGENPTENGSFTLFDNLITWTSDGFTITMTIFNETTGETTEITIPIGDFGFPTG